jgi:hypothetical protein
MKMLLKFKKRGPNKMKKRKNEIPNTQVPAFVEAVPNAGDISSAMIKASPAKTPNTANQRLEEQYLHTKKSCLTKLE